MALVSAAGPRFVCLSPGGIIAYLLVVDLHQLPEELQFVLEGVGSVLSQGSEFLLGPSKGRKGIWGGVG